MQAERLAMIATYDFNTEIERHISAMASIRDSVKESVMAAGIVASGDYVSFDGYPAYESNLSLGVGIVEIDPDPPIGVFDGNFGKVTDKPAKLSVKVRLLRVTDLEISKATTAWVDIVKHNVRKITQAEFTSRVAAMKSARKTQTSTSISQEVVQCT